MAEARRETQVEALLDPRFLKRLERLELNARRILSGDGAGEAQSARRGPGTLFREHRAYVPGDDPRFLDWNAYLRLNELVVKAFQVEESPRLLLCVDCSASMGLAGPQRVLFTKRLAAALGYIALARHATVMCVPFPAAGPPVGFRGRCAVKRFLDFLGALAVGGAGSMLRTLREACPPNRPVGMAVVLSDFLELEEPVQALSFLCRRGFLVHALHVRSPRDLAPEAHGLLELEDAETGRRLRTRLTKALLRDYKEALLQHFKKLEQSCRQFRAGYHEVSVDEPVERTVMTLLREGALLR